MKILFWITGLFLLVQLPVKAQDKSWKFVHLTDTHIGNETAAEDLSRTVKDINANPELQFVLVSGDITEFGTDEELKLAKSILDGLNKPYYIIPGNHDMNWSESGGNSFKTVFGSETFAFKHNGYLFLGTNCGPNMRMSPGQVPRENLVWLDSVLKATPKQMPLIFVNHYPQDSSLNNWFEVTNRLKTHNIQLILCGHGHSNHKLNFEGIPGVMGRSNLRAKDSVGGYSIVTITRDSVFYNERNPGVLTKSVWMKERLYTHNFTQDQRYPRPDYTANQKFTGVKTRWTLQDNSDIGAGTAVMGNLVVVANTAGWVKAYDADHGQLVWSFKTAGKIYSTPCEAGNYVVVASTDKYLYCLHNKTGKIKWKMLADKPIVASPVYENGRVFCGGSDGHFKCYDLETGNLKWDFNQVQGFVVTRPLVSEGKIYFGSWGNHFYVLNQETGAVVWTWDDGYKNRMFSPAACVPVISGNRLFIVAPDRYMTCFNASTGEIIWRKGKDPAFRVRESMGSSADGRLVYVKTMEGDVLGVSVAADTAKVDWKGQQNMGYDISPSQIMEHDDLVFSLSNSGVIYAHNRKDGTLAWMHKLSNCLVNPISFLKNRVLIATTMDGKISCLSY